MKKVFSFVFALSALVLEILPWGAVCNFANPEGKVFRETFSYFSMIPYGNGNFFPLMTAILTAFLVLSLLFSLIKNGEKAENSAFFLSFAASILSICPILYGIRFYSIAGLGITILLFLSALLLWKKDRMK